MIIHQNKQNDNEAGRTMKIPLGTSSANWLYTRQIQTLQSYSVGAVSVIFDFIEPRLGANGIPQYVGAKLVITVVMGFAHVLPVRLWGFLLRWHIFLLLEWNGYYTKSVFCAEHDSRTLKIIGRWAYIVVVSQYYESWKHRNIEIERIGALLIPMF